MPQDPDGSSIRSLLSNGAITPTPAVGLSDWPNPRVDVVQGKKVIYPKESRKGRKRYEDLKWSVTGHIPDYSLQDVRVGDMSPEDAARLRRERMVNEQIDKYGKKLFPNSPTDAERSRLDVVARGWAERGFPEDQARDIASRIIRMEDAPQSQSANNDDAMIDALIQKYGKD